MNRRPAAGMQGSLAIGGQAYSFVLIANHLAWPTSRVASGFWESAATASASISSAEACIDTTLIHAVRVTPAVFRTFGSATINHGG